MRMDRNSMSFYTYATIHGPLTITASERGIRAIDFGNEPGEGQRRPTELTNRAANQMQEYLAGKRRFFDLPLDIKGTAFQQAVWTEANAIPYGETTTAARIAEAIGRPGAHRSVGTALKQNRLAPLIATHRVENPASTGKTARIFRALCAMESSRCAKD